MAFDFADYVEKKIIEEYESLSDTEKALANQIEEAVDQHLENGNSGLCRTSVREPWLKIKQYIERKYRLAGWKDVIFRGEDSVQCIGPF